MTASIISGFATPQATEEYFNRIKDSNSKYKKDNLYQIPASLNGIHVSRIACAVSNMSDANRKNIDTLRQALLNGINTICIPGQLEISEPSRLTYKVIDELIRVKRIKREELIIVSGFGYTTKYNSKYKMYKLKSNLYYSLDPEYLNIQLNILLERLAMQTIDVLMLYQPELLLQYHRRFNQEEKFYLEYEKLLSWINHKIAECKIQHWGICSAAIGKSKNIKDGLTLQQLFQNSIKPNVIQTPFNLLESDFRFNRSIDGGLLSNQLQTKNIWSIVYRPFRAIQNYKSVHLAGDTDPALDGGVSSAAELNRHLTRLVLQEKNIVELFGEKHFKFDNRLPAPSSYLEQYKNHFPETTSFNHSIPGIHKHLQKTFNFIRMHIETIEERYTLDSLENLTNAFFVLWKGYIQACYQQKIEYCQEFIGKTDLAYKNQPLSLQSLLYILSNNTPQTVLISINYPNQIKQILEVFSLNLPDAKSNLSTIAALEQALERFDSRASTIT